MAPVKLISPSFPKRGYPITTRQRGVPLAGIRHYRGDKFVLNRRFGSVAEGLTIFQDDSLLFPPGTRFSYSTYGWNLISAVIEGAAGRGLLWLIGPQVVPPPGSKPHGPGRADNLHSQRTAFSQAGPPGGV